MRCIMKILLITNWLPYPPFAGNPLRVFNLLKRIAQKHQVDLLTYVRQTDSQEAIQTLSQYTQFILITKSQRVPH